jgi:hypothetical protein
MIATVLLGIGIVMGFGGLSSMTKTELRIRETEKMNLLAVQKLNEIVAFGNIANQQTDGNFSESGEPNYKWAMDTTPSGTDNVVTVRVTVTTAADKSTDPSTSASGLVFTSPNAATGGTGG